MKFVFEGVENIGGKKEKNAGLQIQGFWKAVGKQDIACNEQFIHFPQHFLNVPTFSSNLE